MSEQEAKFYVAQIIVAIERMDEDCKIFHHDPHLYNLMMTPKGDILMIDFGLARSPFWSQGEYRVRSLTEEDMVAIEESRLISWIYVSRAAIHMLTGFQEDTVEVWPANIFDSWKGDKPYIMDPKQIENLGSDDLKDFIMTCRTPRVFLFKEFGSIRNHRWLKDVAWEEIESGECLSPFFP